MTLGNETVIAKAVRELYNQTIVRGIPAGVTTMSAADVCELIMQETIETDSCIVLSEKIIFLEWSETDAICSVATAAAIFASTATFLLTNGPTGKNLHSGRHPRYSGKDNCTVYGCLSDVVLVTAASSCTGVVNGFNFLNLVSQMTSPLPSELLTEVPSQRTMFQLCDWLPPEEGSILSSTTLLSEDEIESRSPTETKLTFSCFALIPSWLSAIVYIAIRCPEHESVRKVVKRILANGMLLTVLRRNVEVPSVVFSSILKVCVSMAKSSDDSQCDKRLLSDFCKIISCYTDHSTTALLVSPIADMAVDIARRLNCSEEKKLSICPSVAGSSIFPIEGVDISCLLSCMVRAFAASSLQLIMPGVLENIIPVLLRDISSNYKQYFSLVSCVAILLHTSLSHAYHFQYLLESNGPLHSPQTVLFKPYVNARDLVQCDPKGIASLLHQYFVTMTVDHRDIVCKRCESELTV